MTFPLSVSNVSLHLLDAALQRPGVCTTINDIRHACSVAAKLAPALTDRPKLGKEITQAQAVEWEAWCDKKPAAEVDLTEDERTTCKKIVKDSLAIYTVGQPLLALLDALGIES